MLTDTRIVLESVLDRFVTARESAIDLFTALIAAIRPRRAGDGAEAARRFRIALDLVAANERYRDAVRDRLVALFAETRQVSFYTNAGILPSTGFFSELWRRIAQRLLPEVPDPTSFKDVLALVFHGPRDYLWLAGIPVADRLEFWRLLAPDRAADHDAYVRGLESLLESVEILGARIAAMGVEPELARVLPDIKRFTSPFLAVGAESARFVAACRTHLGDAAARGEDDRHLQVLVEQCLEAVERARRTAAKTGTSMRLTYLIVRLHQSLERLRLLASVVGARHRDAPGDEVLRDWSLFFRHALVGIIRRNSLREHVNGLIGLLALRVTENAGRTGEHYIAEDRREYFGMWRSAGGAGVIIGVMALIKILASKLALAPLQQAFLYSMNYSLGFMLIHTLHLTIATKQPAMTAATIASTVHEVSGRLRDLDRLVALIVATVRSQIAAILGNVLVALPVAIAVGLGLGRLAGHPIISPEKAFHLLEELNPVSSLAVFHAAIAGVYLFLSGLISGYFDNRASYDRVGDRVAALRWLNWLVGRDRAARFGRFVHANLGGLMGNFFFGIMLGATGTVGALIGLPLDIRHIAFSSANFGYALVGLDFAIPTETLWWSLAGIALIGFANLTVSFALALWVALKSRGVTFTATGELGLRLLRHFWNYPEQFLFPPRQSTVPGSAPPT